MSTISAYGLEGLLGSYLQLLENAPWSVERLFREVGQQAPLKVENISGVETIGIDTEVAVEMLKSFAEKRLADEHKPEILSAEKEALRKMFLRHFKASTVTTTPVKKVHIQPFPLRKQMLMVTPDYMTTGRNFSDRINIRRKWEAAKHALTLAGITITAQDSMQPENLIDCFPRDRVFFIGRVAYIPDDTKSYGALIHHPDLNPHQKKRVLKDMERYAQNRIRLEPFLQARGYQICPVPGAWFEGGNIIPHMPSRTIFLGEAPRSDISPEDYNHFRNLLQAAINKTQREKWTIVPVPLQVVYDTTSQDHDNETSFFHDFGSGFDDDFDNDFSMGGYDNDREASEERHSIFYHLDIGFSKRLFHGEHLICPDVTDAQTYQKIKDIIGRDKIIEIDQEDAIRGSACSVSHGKTIVMSGVSESLKLKIQSRGYSIITAADYGMDSFDFESAGVDCLTNELAL